MNLRTTVSIAIPLVLFPACGGGGGNSSAHPGTPPSALAYSENFSVYMVDASHAPLTASVTGTVTQWSVAPALPAGLTLDPATGQIAGTPQASAARQSYTVTASNSAGSTQTAIQLSVEQPERYAYVTCTNDRTISIFGMDVNSGAVARRGFVAGQPWEGHPEAFEPHASGRFGYSTTGEGILSTWAIDAVSGWLTELDAQAIVFGPHSFVGSPDGRFLFLAQQNGNGVTTYHLDPSSGFPTQVGPGFAVAAQPVSIAINPAGTLLAVASQGDASSGVGSTLTLLGINPNDGTLQQLGAGLLLNGAQPAGCAFSTRQNVVYLSLPSTSRVVAVGFDPATGDLQSLGGFFSGAGCGKIVCDPFARHLWAVNTDAGTLTTFAIQPNGSIVGAGSLSVGTNPAGLALDPLGRFFFAVDSSTQELGLFDLNAQSGAPSHRTGWLTRSTPTHVSFARGEHGLSSTSFELLSCASGSNELFATPVDPSTGALGAGVSVATASGPVRVTVDPLQRFAFTANAQDHSISRYRIDPTTGSLSELQPKLAVDGTPSCIAADASGRFVYLSTHDVQGTNDGWLSTFGLDPTTGALTLLGSVAAGVESNWLGMDPTGQFLYVANAGDGTSGSATIQVFRLATQTGLPTGASLSLAAAGAWSLGFHPTGRYLYAVLHNSNSTVPFQISEADGSLSAVDAGVQSALVPMAVALTPDGHWAYIASSSGGGPGSIGLYAVEQSSGKLLPPASPFADGSAPLDVCVDGSGTHLYTANSGTDSISAFAIDGSDGFLQPQTPAAAGLVPSALVLLQRWL